MRKNLSLVVVTVLGLAASAANATADYTALSSAVDFTSAGTAVIAGMAAMATIGVLIKGGSAILRKLGIRF